ncbi:MAG: hypothetical protein ABI790_00660 [Betaproteobacteria bacterium]
MKYLALVFAASTLAGAAFAQTAPSPPEPAAPKHNCVKPVIIDMSKKITEPQMAAFVASLNKYKECSEGYAQAQQKEAERVQKAAQVTAQALVAAGNVAIKEYNDFVEEAGKVMAAKPTPPKAPEEVQERGSVDTVPSRIPRKN